MNLLKYRPVEVAPFTWEDRPYSLRYSLWIRYQDFLYKRFPKFQLRYYWREHVNRALSEILATEIRKEIDKQIITEIQKTL